MSATALEALNDLIEVGAPAVAQHAVGHLVVKPAEFAVRPPTRRMHVNDLERGREPARQAQGQRECVFAEIRAVQRHEQ